MVNGTVKNLHVDVDIDCKMRLVGGICGENNGTIENCWVSGYVRSEWTGSGYSKVGGIAGENNGTIKYCCMSGNVYNKDDNVGGIAGDNDGTIIVRGGTNAAAIGGDYNNMAGGTATLTTGTPSPIMSTAAATTLLQILR